MSKIEKFAKNWERELKEPATSKIRSALLPSSPLKYKIDLTMTRLKTQVDKLNQAMTRLMEKERKIFDMVVDAYMKHDVDRATLYANELAELRKVSKIILYSKLSLEKVLLRLGTIKDVGELLVAVAPVIGVVRAIKSCLAGILPGAEQELNELSYILNSLVTEIGEATGQPPTLETTEEAQKILEEAMAVAEQKIKEKLPVLPTSEAPVSSRERTNK
ncbi:MAG: Snf7 family protein [Candidatus Nezhaarchaeota archaeon]|nr:Snf7 family protein [Candidatus Nezhaarchaeota archaeon]